MSFTLLDIGLFAIMLISGLLALTRGFTREILALLCWGGAAIAAIFLALQPNFQDFTRQTFKPIPAEIAPYVGAGGAFVIILIVLSLLTMRISDWILDSGIGALDRTLGFVFGLARGLVLVAIGYLFFVWLVPGEPPQPVRQAQSLPFIQRTADFIISLLPPDIADTLQGKSYRLGTDGKGDPQKSDAEEEEGAKTTQRGLDQYLQGAKPVTGQPPGAATQPAPAAQPGLQPQKPGTTVQQQPLQKGPQQPQAQQQQPPQPQKRN